MDHDDYPRRYHPRPTESKGVKVITILLLLINTSALSCLLFLNFQSHEKADKQELRLDSIEKKLDTLSSKQLPSTQVATTTTTTTASSVESSTTTTESSTSEEAASSETTIPSSIEQEITPSSSDSSNSTQQQTQNATSYTVKAGDTLSSISEKYGLSVEELMTKNDLTDSTLLVGQELNLK